MERLIVPISSLNGSLAHRVMRIAAVFNWVRILSHYLLKALEKAIQKQAPKGTTFYFAGYLLDALCTSNSFLD
jgi:hypothetical protein